MVCVWRQGGVTPTPVTGRGGLGWVGVLLLALFSAQESATAASADGAATATSAAAPSIVASDPLKDPIQLLGDLEAKRKSLDERAKWLELREIELKRLEEKIDKRISALEELRLEIQQDLAREKEVNDTNISRLSKIYSGMKPKDAAEQLRSLDRRTAVKILKVMPEKVAANILGKMGGQDAVDLADELGILTSDKRRKSGQ